MSSANWINGNYFVRIDADGTKSRRALRIGEKLIPNFPESLDIKLTNKCSIGCPFCHENSNPQGKVCDPDRLIKVLDQLPRVPIEFAFGGGDVFESQDELKKILEWSENNGYLNRVTINYRDLEIRQREELEKLFIGTQARRLTIGLSLSNWNKEIEERIKEFEFFFDKVVFHIITGVFPVEKLESLLDNDIAPVLVLGYKNFGRGKFYTPKQMDIWKDTIKQRIFKYRLGAKTGVLAFDNLAIEQLGIKESLFQEEWDRTYQGNEFSCSMYVDAVEEMFAPTSRSTERVSWNSIGIVEYFQKGKQDYEN